MNVDFLGHIEAIRYTDTAILITVSERRLGYRKKDGSIVDDEILNYKIIFKLGMRAYISKFFDTGMLVSIKGIVLPYAKDHQGNIVEGYSIIGETMSRAAYPSKGIRNEKRAIKESQISSSGTPDLDSYNEPDF